jgi:fatty-acyl-CoA synthase
LHSFTTGGSALPVSVAKTFQKHFGIALREVWGGTEFQGILSFHYGGDTPPRWGSCGRTVPFFDVRAAVVENGRFIREAVVGERGTLIATGPTIVGGFVDPANDTGFFLEAGPDNRRWGTTGDIGHIDADGFIWIGGRVRDVIIRGGHNIDSAMIDDALIGHPGVMQAAAVAMPCPRVGELPIAFVEPAHGASITPAELMEFARSTIQERAAIPVEIFVVDTIPLTAVGKVFKPPLRARAMELAVGRQCRALGITPARILVEDDEVTVVLDDADAERTSALAEALGHFAFSSRLAPSSSLA